MANGRLAVMVFWYFVWSLCLSATAAATLVEVNAASALFPDRAWSTQFDRSVGVQERSLRKSLVPSINNWLCEFHFCLELHWTSDFQSDFFELDRYESKYPGVIAELLDPEVASQPSRPLVDGVVPSDPTIWIFHSDFMYLERVPMIDLLLCLRQQSQRYASRDQFLVRFNGTFTSEFSATLAVDSVSSYGSQELEYKTFWQTNHHLIVRLHLSRNPNKNDANFHDPLPLDQRQSSQQVSKEPIYQWIWRFVHPKCLLCTSQLFGCGTDDVVTGQCTYEATSNGLINCLRTKVSTQDFTTWLSDASSNSRHDISSAITQCVDGMTLMGPQLLGDFWWKTMQSLSCLARHECPFGPLSIYSNTRSQVNKHIVMSASDSVLTHTIWFPLDLVSAPGVLHYGFLPFYNFVSLNPAADAVDFIVANTEEIAGLVNKTLNRGLPNALIDKTLISVTRSLTNSAVQVEITIQHLPFPRLVGGFQALDPASVSTLKDDLTVPAVVLETKSSVLAFPVDKWNWIWEYASPDCLAATVALLGCQDSSQILTGVCTFESTADPFVSCLRQRFGVQVFEQLKSPTVSNHDAGTAINDCFNVLWSLHQSASVSSNQWLTTLVSLNQLSRSQCPFGPLPDLLSDVTPSNIVTLADNGMYHSVHIPSSTFSITLSIDLGPFQTLRTSAFTETSTDSDIMDAIQNLLSGVLGDAWQVQVTKDFDVNTGQWQIGIAYHGIVLPGFQSRFEYPPELENSVTDAFIKNAPEIKPVHFVVTTLDAAKRCHECDKALQRCRLDVSCRTQALSSVISELSTVPVMDNGNHLFDLLALLKKCFKAHPQVNWQPLLRALSCFAEMRCIIGDFQLQTNQDVAQSFQIVEPLFEVQWTDLTSETLKKMMFNSDIATLRTLLKAYVVQDPADVWVSTDYNPNFRVNLHYMGLPIAWPSFHAEGLVMGPSTPVSLQVFSPSSDLTSSVRSLTSHLAQYITEIGTPDSATVASTTAYSPSCTQCQVAFSKCTMRQVISGECAWSSGGTRSQLSKCLIGRLPAMKFETLSYQPIGSSIPIRGQVDQCVDALLQAGESARDLHTLLSCFPSAKCAFGPVQFAMTGDATMIQLKSSPYTHSFRIPSSTFRIRLFFQFDDPALVDISTVNGQPFTTPLLTSQMSIPQFRDAIQLGVPDHVQVQVRVLTFVDFYEWHVQVEYHNVMFSRFRASVLSEDRALNVGNRIPQQHFFASPRLVQSAQDPDVLCTKCQQYLRTCVSIPNCRDQVVPCLIQQLTNGVSATGTRMDVTNVLQTCFSGTNIANWLPVQQFLSCYVRFSCPLNAIDPAPATTSTTKLFLELSPVIQFTVPSGAQAQPPPSLELTIVPVPNGVPDLNTLYYFSGSISALKSTLQDTILAGAASVVVISTQIVVDSIEKTQLSIQLGNYCGQLPQFQGANVADISQQALVMAMQTTNGIVTWQRLLDILSTYH